MHLNFKSLWVFISCLAVVISSHVNLLAVYPEWVKDSIVLLALTIIALNNNVVYNGVKR